MALHTHRCTTPRSGTYGLRPGHEMDCLVGKELDKISDCFIKAMDAGGHGPGIACTSDAKHYKLGEHVARGNSHKLLIT